MSSGKETFASHQTHAEREREIKFLAPWYARSVEPTQGGHGLHLGHAFTVHEAFTVLQYTYRDRLALFIEERWLLLCIRNGTVLGARETAFKQAAPRTMIAGGYIEVLQKGAGIATMIENLHLSLLQQKARSLPEDKQLIYTINDANRNYVEDAEHELKRATREQDKDLLRNTLTKAREQRSAWLSLYGEGGKLNFTEKNGILQRTFTKEGSVLLPTHYVEQKRPPSIDPATLLQDTLKQLRDRTS